MRWLVLAVVLVIAAPAFADDKPWAAGVSAEHQKAALDLYNKGNVAFEQAEYKEALETYTQALALWDHPAIRYNAAVCRINLDRPLEAYEDLQLALRFGVAPLGPELFKQGENYQKLLAKQVAELGVTVDQVGATITVDGKPWAGTHHVLAGDHQIVVEKPGFETHARSVKLGGGETLTDAVVLAPVAAARTLHRRWSRWIPYAVLAAGAIPTAAGAWFYRSSRNDYIAYDRAVTDDFNTHPGAPPTATTLAFQHDADREATMAYTAFAIGGAVIATGFVMVILNQPKLGVVTPVVGGDHAGLAFAGTF